MSSRRNRLGSSVLHAPGVGSSTGGTGGGGGVSGDPNLTLTAISPGSTVTAGGATATLTGTNFVGPIDVTFGETAATGTGVTNSSTATCTIPSRASSGAVTITLEQGTKLATLSNFTYFGVPTIATVSPSSVNTLGDTIVTLSGANYIASSTTVGIASVGTVAQASVHVGATFSTLTFTAPSSNTTGTFNMNVQTASGVGSSANAITYASTDEPDGAGVTFADLGSGSQAALVFDTTHGLSDNFDWAPSVAGMVTGWATYGWRTRPNSESPNAGMVLVTGRGGSGQAVEAQFPAGEALSWGVWTTPWDSGAGSTTGLPAYSGTLVTQGYFRGTGAGLYLGKWWEMWYRTGATDPAGRIQAGIWTNNAGGTNPAWHINPNNVESAYQPIGPYPADVVNDGAWHRMTIAYKPNTSDGARDGLFRIWIDGIKIVDLSSTAAAEGTPAGGTKVWCTAAEIDNLGYTTNHRISFIRFPDYANYISGGPLNLAWDDVKYWVIP